MRILAVDTSQIQASVCALDGKQVLAAERGSVSVAHSEGLLALIDQVVSRLHLQLSDFDLFAAGVGPGSFTGIRIGCASIKAIAQVLGKPVLPISSLKALAFSADPMLSKSTVAMANAYQGEVFVGWLDQENGGKAWREQAVGAKQWAEHYLTRNSDKSVQFCGLGAKAYWSEISSQSNLFTLAPDVDHVSPTGLARAVIYELFEANRSSESYLTLHANYLRPSQAEAKLDRLRSV